MIKSAVVTGASGMIGATTIRELNRRGIEVLALVRPGSSKLRNLPVSPLVKTIECELDGFYDFLDRHEKGSFDAFFHFAWDGTYGEARNDATRQTKNIGYTIDAIELASRLGCEVFIGAGSQAEYGPASEKLAPETPVRPMNGYGIAKYCAGKLGAIRARQLGMRFVWTRILSVYGPMDNHYSFTMNAILKRLRGEETQFTRGEQVWDFLFSEDAARAMVLIAEKGRDGAVYCLGSGIERRLSDAIGIICSSIRPDLPTGLGSLPYPDGQVMYLCADIARLAEDTGFCPEVSLEEGLARTIAFAKHQYISD